MKYLFFIAALFVSHQTLADDLSTLNGTYKVTEYTWCNGPHGKPTPGSCAQVGWRGVKLDGVAIFHLQFDRQRKFLRIQDVDGKIWEKDLNTCVPYPLQTDQCHENIKEAGGLLAIQVTDLPPSSSRNLQMAIKFDGKELSFFSPDQAYIRLKVEKQN